MDSPLPDDSFRSRLKLSGSKDRMVLVVALAILSAVSPMASDMYLASMPRMGEFFATPASVIQLTLTSYMVGMAVGQFLLGPISDVLGRHRLMVAGNVVFLLASVAIALAPSIELVLGLRVLQGVSGAAGVVIARAAVSDMASGRQAAKLFSLLATISALAPVVAPLLGGVIATVAPWQAAFWALAGFGALMLACSVLVVPETLPRHLRHRGGLKAVAGGSWAVLTTPSFMAYAMTFGFTFGALFSYISASSFVVQNVLGFSALGYSVIFAVNAGGMIVASLINTRLVDRVEPAVILRAAVVAMFAINVAGMGLVLGGITGWSTLLHLFLTQACVGFIMGNATALAQGRVPGRAGAGSAVLGLIQFLIGGLVSPLTGIAGEHSAVPMAVSMAVCSAIAIGGVMASGRLAAAGHT
ncbi:multidrug effflux MFS transporter [Pseudarthrobacter sp. H3Y2-7]|jgi:DHA1 family bicyclomycin/chloramphenicol resistance-like MFS transporter|uniref:multidrug effflux MFS transporter n=1 Tax=Pseudarthrobacter naphthalenicus TaxID=3031328 RepID=UPI0023B0838B|nr:multidrug effflux MFS transporter [Pseudarthrobacter sp. H3Y2-7]MDE8668189.1 multidrug effflux MFS transporter [Pseudarthrobacter sp. H3Y2-7]